MVNDESNSNKNGEELSNILEEEISTASDSSIYESTADKNKPSDDVKTDEVLGAINTTDSISRPTENVKSQADSLLVSDSYSDKNPLEEAFKTQVNSQPVPPANPYYPPPYTQSAPAQPQYGQQPQQPMPNNGYAPQSRPAQSAPNPTYDSIGTQTQYTNHYPGNNPYSYYNAPMTGAPTPPSGGANPGMYSQMPYTQGPQGGHTVPPQGPNLNKNPYNWNFNNYNQTPPKQNLDKKRGGKKVRNVLIGVCLVALMLVGIYGVYSKNMATALLDDGVASSSEESLAEEVSGGIEIKDSSKGENNLSAAYGNSLTIKQVYAKVNPSIVAIQVFVPTGLTNNASGEGSGVIMSEDGYIITNAHVISDSTAIKVVLSNEEVYEAKVVGSDINTDLALLKIEATGLTPAEFGDSTLMEIGDLVVAIGNPGGLQFSGSATVGYVSNLDRNITDSYGFSMSCIQTDAAINPGNSGGALANDLGQVIGITSSKVSATSFEGMGFAIPMHEVKPIIDMLMRDGRVTGRPMIGITYSQIIDDMTGKIYSLPSGIIVAEVTAGTDAEAKGLKAGDIIHKINDTVITESADIQSELKGYNPGDTVTLTIFRRDFLDSKNSQGEEITVDIILTENPS